MFRWFTGVIVLGVLVGSGLVLDLSPAHASPASSSVPVLRAAPDDWIVVPGGSNSKFREFRLNVTSSTLGKFTPDKWQREQAANAARYNMGGEYLNVKHGYESVGGWGASGAQPGTTEEYNMQRMEFEKTASFTKPDGTKVKGSKPLVTVPLTKNAKLNKVAGGAAGVITAGVIGWGAGVAGGKLITNMMGIDADRGLCQPTFEDFGIIGAITGTDCAALLAFDAQYEPNMDVVPGYTNMLPYCATDGRGAEWCVVMVGERVQMNGTTPWRVACFDFTKDGAVTSPYVMNDQYASPRLYLQLATSSGLAPMTGGGSGWCSPPWPSAGFVTLDRGVDLGSRGSVVSYFITSSAFGVGAPYGGGSPVVPVFSDETDPSRFLTCSITGTDGITYTKDSVEYVDSSGAVAAPECPELPEGVGPQGAVTVDRNTNGLIDRVQDLEVNEEFVDWWNTYPECRSGGCKLDLIMGQSPTTAASCFDIGTPCADWFEDPERADKFSCRYGVHTVDIEECFVYSGTFKPGRVEAGAPYSDPLTGTWSGGENAPSPDRQALEQLVQNPASSRSCNGMASVGFDPVAWVLRPIQCALEWAFVPRPAVIAVAGASMTTALDSVAPGQLVSMIGGWDIDPTPMGGCSRVAAYSPMNGFAGGEGESTVLWDVCPGSDMEVLGTISRSVVAVGFAVLVFLSIKRSVGSTVDYR